MKLAVCAGHKGAGLDKGIPLLERHLEQASIPYCHIDSLNSTQVTIDHRVQQMGDKAGIVSDVFDDFFQRYLSCRSAGWLKRRYGLTVGVHDRDRAVRHRVDPLLHHASLHILPRLQVNPADSLFNKAATHTS